MRLGPRLAVNVLMALILMLFAACEASPESSPTTAADVATSVTRPPTTAVEEPVALCNAYLVLLRSGDSGPIRAAVDDDAVLEDIDVMLSSDGEFEAISAAALRVEEHVVSRCTERFTAGLEPAAADAAALTRFLDAFAAGDQDAAAEVAWAHVVAQFSWAAADVEYEVEGSTATADLGADLSVTCRAQRGAVVSCRFGSG